MPEVGIPNSGSLYGDARVKVAEPPGLDKGSVVAWEYEQRLPPYAHEDSWFFQDDIPKLAQSFVLNFSPGYRYTAAWAHHAEEKATDLGRIARITSLAQRKTKERG